MEWWWEEVRRHGDDWCATTLYVVFWLFAGTYALIRLFMAWDWDALPDMLLAAIASSGFVMILASLSRFWRIVPCYTPTRVKISFALHLLAFAQTIWAWICFAETGLPVFAAENESQHLTDGVANALYYVRIMLALTTITHVGNLFVCGCHALCAFLNQAPPAANSSFTLAPLAPLAPAATPFLTPPIAPASLFNRSSPVNNNNNTSPSIKSYAEPLTNSPDSAAYIVNHSLAHMSDEPLLQVSTDDLSEPSSL